MSILGNNLKKWRESNSITIKEVAETIGYNQDEYSNIENGTTNINNDDIFIEIIFKLYNKFNIELDEIFGINIKGFLTSKLNSLYYWINSVDRVIEHQLSIGLEMEYAVKCFLKEYIPEKYGIEKGFIVSLEKPELKLRELDVIFTQKDYSIPIGAYEGFKIFPYEAVLGAMGVTKILSTQKMKDEFQKYSELYQITKRQVDIPAIKMLKYLENFSKTIEQLKTKIENYNKTTEVPEYYLESLRDILENSQITDLSINIISNTLNEKLDNVNKEKRKLEETSYLRNRRLPFQYCDMPLRFFYFANNIDSSEKTFLQNLNKYRGKIPIHGMFILKRRLFITSMGKMEAYIAARGEKSYPQFIYSIIESLNNHFHIQKDWTIKIKEYLELIDRNSREDNNEKVPD